MSSAFPIVQYAANSYIIVEGQKDLNLFFIIREGKVRISRDTGNFSLDSNQILGPGDFFGVVSAMCLRPHIEAATAITNVSLLSIHHDNFGILIQKSPSVAMNLIRFFSQKLRQYDREITNMGAENPLAEDPNEIFTIGEYFLNEGLNKQAAYCFQSYLRFVPQGKNIESAKEKLESIFEPYERIINDHGDKAKLNFSYDEGNMIFCEHEPGDELHIIQRGKVKISKVVDGRERILAFLQEGDIFGEMAILNNKPRSANAIAWKETDTLAITKKNFEAVVKAQPQLATRLIQLLSDRIWTAYKNLMNYILRDVEARIVDYLYFQVERNRVKIAARTSYSYGISASDLCKFLALPPEKEMEIHEIISKLSFIKLDGGLIYCSDTLELEKYLLYIKKKLAMESKIRRPKN
jgi:CRP/FNR family transcriptional regulator